MNHSTTTLIDTRRNGNHSDPITGTRGAHPVGTGLGAASGGIAGAALGAFAGPLGIAFGLAGGAFVGGLAGKGVAETIEPTVEDAYWASNRLQRKYVERNASFHTYRMLRRNGRNRVPTR